MNEQVWSSSESIGKLSKDSIGIDTANKVAIALCNGRTLMNHHRDYCGHGLDFQDSTFRLFECNDGYVSKILYKWSNQETFVNFLAKQSDYSMSGADVNEPVFYTEDKFLINNQTITKLSLNKFSGFIYSKNQIEVFNFFTRGFSEKKQKQLKNIFLKLDTSYESAITTILSKKTQKVIFEFGYSHTNEYENEDIASELNDLSHTQGIKKEFIWQGSGSMYDVVQAYNNFLVTLGFRFIYWISKGLYSFAGFIVKEDQLDEILVFANKNDLLFLPILASCYFPSWFTTDDGKMGRKQNLKLILAQGTLASKKHGRNFFIYASMQGCAPCVILENNILHPKMLDAFENTYIVKVDLLHNSEELDNYLNINSAPTFTYISPDARAIEYTLEGDAWGDEDTVENISKTLKVFFNNIRQSAEG